MIWQNHDKMFINSVTKIVNNHVNIFQVFSLNYFLHFLLYLDYKKENHHFHFEKGKRISGVLS